MHIRNIFTVIPAAMLVAGAAAAQSESPEAPDERAGGVLEEVVVSGYRIQPVLESDLSVTLLDETAVEQASVMHFEELIPLVPNMNFSGEGARARYLQLRGIGEREQYEGAPNPSVGVFVDDIDLSGVGGVASTFDLDQVEVLRGPQSARFGASALAGVVYMRSADPTEDFSSRAELTTGNDGLLAAGAAVGGPLAGSALGRLSVYHEGSDGFRDNVWLNRHTQERDELTVRGKLGWAFGDWDGLLSLLYADFDNGYDHWTVLNDDETESDHPGRDEQRTAAGSLRLEGGLGDAVDLVSITTATDSDIFFSFDGDWGNPEFWGGYGDYVYDYRYRNPRQRDSLSQELRLVSEPAGRLFGNTDWVLGAYWNRLEEDNAIDSTGVYDDSGEENFCAPCLTDRQIDSRYRADTLAVFASTETALTERWALSLGLRYEYWDARYADQWRDINYPGPPDGESCANFDCRPDENLWGGHAALAYTWDSGLRAYARVARGFKAGGFNPSLAALQGVAILGPGFIPYQPETLMNYELGLKGLWLDGRLAADLAVFHMDRDDAQLSQSSQQVAFDPNSFVFVTYNADAEVDGLEATARWQLTDTWALHGALGLLDSEIGDTQKTRLVSPDAVGRGLAHAPDYTLNLGASFATPDGWFGRLDVNAVDAYYFDISHDQRSDDYATVNLRVGKSWGEWSLSAWARNLTDETWYTRGFYFGNEPPAFPDTLYTRFGDPRAYGLTLRYATGG